MKEQPGSIKMGGHTFRHGDLLAAPAGDTPGRRHENGLRFQTEALFLVLFDEVDQITTLSPVSWAVAQYAMPGQLQKALSLVRI